MITLFLRRKTISKLDRLLDIAVSENIHIRYVPEIPSLGAEALYISRDGIRLILLLETLKDNLIHLTEVLAEEIGHYFTSVGNNINAVSYFDRLKIDKCESKAMRWACDFLVPKDELIENIKKCPSGLDDLADMLEVSKDILIQGLYYLSLNNDIIRIDDNKYLILCNYPNVYIYNKL